MQLALAAAAAALSGLGEDLGGTAALGGGLAETFQRLLPRIFFFLPFSFSQESATATAGERKASKRLLLEPMQPFGSPRGASLPG